MTRRAQYVPPRSPRYDGYSPGMPVTWHDEEGIERCTGCCHRVGDTHHFFCPVLDEVLAGEPT